MKPPTAPLPEAAFSGCLEIVNGVCKLGRSRELKVWVQGKDAACVFTAGQTPLPSHALVVRGGRLFQFKVEPGGAAITITCGGRQLRSLRVEGKQKDAELAHATGLAQSDIGAARQLLEGLLIKANEERAARIRSLLGRIEMQQGEYDEALSLLEVASQGFAKAGHSLLLGQELMTMSFIAVTRKGDPRKAETYLRRASDLLSSVPQLRGEHAYQKGLLESLSGNVRGALREFEQALLWSERLGDEDVSAAAKQWMAMTMSSLGRLPEAMALQMQLVDAAKGAIPCIRVPLLATAAWLALQQHPLDVTFVRGRLSAARELLDKCPDRFRARNVLVNEVELMLAIGDTKQAHKLLEELRQQRDGQTVNLAVQELELQGRLMLANSHAKSALQSFERAESIARASALNDEALHLTVLRARALALMGRRREAARLLEETEQKLDRRLQMVPVGEARVRFLKVRDEGVRALVALHLADGHTQQAFEAARRGRSRALRALAIGESLTSLTSAAKLKWLADLAAYQEARAEEEEAAQSWSLPQDELSDQAAVKAERAQAAEKALDTAYGNLVANLPHAESPLKPLVVAPGELVFLFFRESGEEENRPWRGFALTDTAIQTASLPSVTALAEGADHPWLLAFTSFVTSARRIRVLSTGAITEELHTATFNKRALGQYVPVVYSLDVSSPAAAEGRALVVADPSEDLPAASVEGKEVMALLKAKSGLFGAQSTRQAVMASLPKAGWFHYAGHSVFGAHDGLDSGLPLARQQRLLATDVLSLPAVPKTVVLSACEASRSSGDTNTAGLGLAQAFLLAGAKAVIAPTRPVSDTSSRAFMQRLYKHVSLGLPPEEALQVAASEANAQQESDWSTFRVLVP